MSLETLCSDLRSLDMRRFMLRAGDTMLGRVWILVKLYCVSLKLASGEPTLLS
jgi:hypothetical protein